MQTDFVAHVSHQLKTPLSLLSAATETLEMDRVRSPERFAEYLRDDPRGGGAAVVAGAARARVLARAAGTRLRVRARRSRRRWCAKRLMAFAHGLSTQDYLVRGRTGRPDAVRARRSGRARAGARQSARQRREVLRRRSRRSWCGCAAPTDTRWSRSSTTAWALRRGSASASSSGSTGRPGRTGPDSGSGLPIVRELIQAHRGTVEVVSTARTRQHVPHHAAARSVGTGYRDRRGEAAQRRAS